MYHFQTNVNLHLSGNDSFAIEMFQEKSNGSCGMPEKSGSIELCGRQFQTESNEEDTVHLFQPLRGNR